MLEIKSYLIKSIMKKEIIAAIQRTERKNILKHFQKMASYKQLYKTQGKYLKA